MDKFTVKIKLLTPVWTGGLSGRPEGLKMSGIIGGMRQCFEALVRKHGGHTCNITGKSDHRCNYENNHNVCPACKIFGCTGLSRGFKINLDLKNRSVFIPEVDPIIHNRPHYSQVDWNNGHIPADEIKRFQSNGVTVQYNQSCSIDTWLAGINGLQLPNKKGGMGMPGPNCHKEAQDYLKKEIRVSFSPELVESTVYSLRIIESDVDLHIIIKYLFAYMAKYSGLGAKVRQGWGQFYLADESLAEIEQKGSAALRKLIDICHFKETNWDAGLPNTSDCFSAEWSLDSDNLGFQFPQKITLNPEYREIGFGMNYRLRRYIKFYEVDGYGKIPVANGWKSIKHGHSRWDNAPWHESIAFVRAMFGRDMSDENSKHSGLVGTSHLFQKEGKWHIKLFGRIPQSYNYRIPNIKLNLDSKLVREFLISRMSELLENNHPIISLPGGTLK
jgi:CRISPR type III-B/RAMP module RAMP protein Cmr1